MNIQIEGIYLVCHICVQVFMLTVFFDSQVIMQRNSFVNSFEYFRLLVVYNLNCKTKIVLKRALFITMVISFISL